MSRFTRVVRNFFTVLLSALLLLTLSSCAGGNTPDAPRIILNGKRLRVYTSHYYVSEDSIEIPVGTFLESIGAENAESPLNAYRVTCYSFMGKRYVLDENARLFMLEDDYVALSKELEEEGKKLSRKNAAGRDLLSENDDVISIPTEEIFWSPIYVDPVSLLNALRKSGVDITIQYDYSTRTITVNCPDQGD